MDFKPATVRKLVFQTIEKKKRMIVPYASAGFSIPKIIAMWANTRNVMRRLI